MSTRGYLPISGTPPITVTRSSFWAYAGAHFALLPASKTKTNTDISTNQVDGAIALTPGASAQHIFGPFAAYSWTPSDTIKLQMQHYNGTAGGNFIAASIRVVSADGGTVRGTLFEGYGPTALVAGNTYNRSLGAAGAAVNVQNSVAMQDGDWIVIETGVKFVQETGQDYLMLGDNSATDLPENETDTGDKNPWVEFSPTLADAGGGATNVCMNII